MRCWPRSLRSAHRLTTNMSPISNGKSGVEWERVCVTFTTEEEHSGSKRLGEKYSKTLQCAGLRQMGIGSFTQYFRISLRCDGWLLLNSRRSHPFNI